MKIAAAAYQPEWHDDWDALAGKLDRWVATAHADLLVFPEYAGVEAALLTGACPNDAIAWRDAMADKDASWKALHSTLARRHGVHILAGSLAVRDDAGFVNRAYLCAPSGQIGHQDKLIPTPYERQAMGLDGGQTLHLFETALGRIGVLICYDSEFPLLARQLVVAGANMILVPSCTEFAAGQTRVRQSCRARAIEGQCLIVQAPLVGDVPDCEVADTNTGRAGFFCPPDHGLPSNGIIMQGETDVPGWVTTTVAPKAIASARASGQVSNFDHWSEQEPHIKPVISQMLV